MYRLFAFEIEDNEDGEGAAITMLTTHAETWAEADHAIALAHKHGLKVLAWSGDRRLVYEDKGALRLAYEAVILYAKVTAEDKARCVIDKARST